MYGGISCADRASSSRNPRISQRERRPARRKQRPGAGSSYADQRDHREVVDHRDFVVLVDLADTVGGNLIDGVVYLFRLENFAQNKDVAAVVVGIASVPVGELVTGLKVYSRS